VLAVGLPVTLSVFSLISQFMYTIWESLNAFILNVILDNFTKKVLMVVLV
jgi:hypothetical protein